MRITSWATFRKKYVKEKYYVRDGVKGWVRDSVIPTLSHYGWKICGQEYGYTMFCYEKPKAMAKRIITENKMDTDKYEFLYYPYYYTGNNGFMDAFYLLRREYKEGGEQ